MRTRSTLIGGAATVLTALALGAGVAQADSPGSTASPTGGAATEMVAVTPPAPHRLRPTIFDIVWYCHDTDGGGWPSVGECIHQHLQAD